MMNPWHDLPVGELPPERVTAVIEIPRGSRNKYELDKKTGQEVEHFFHIYKDLEGRRVEIVGWEKSEVALAVINDSIARYEETYHRVGP